MDVDDGRHWPNNLDDTKNPSLEAINASLNQLLLQCDAFGCTSPSIYHGACGVALLYLRVADHYPERASNYLSKALDICRAAEQRFHKSRVTFLGGIPGCWAVQAAIYRARGDEDACRDRVRRVLDVYDTTVRLLPAKECEVLYGRCGYLQAILFLRRSLNRKRLGREVVVSVIREVFENGIAQAQSRGYAESFRVYYEWHGKCYLGAAHGLGGILYMLSQFPEEVAQSGHSLSTLRHSALHIIQQLTLSSGNIASSLGNTNDRLVHWCHGAPGWVDTCLALGMLDDALRFGEVIWTRGLLSQKGPGLCHGIPGNGYVFLSLWRATGNAVWLRRARLFAVFAAERMPELLARADSPFSMFEGGAGAACFFMDCIAPGEATTVYFDRFT
eukprot:Plantae.Rhodophyta-Hildenbrandia_rubra.ctg3309.p1 GENE.Plantae.Rhodophyta-Hildenbrandia_rubra.ctg3309~~Plantae.Rhodophyta-Hildenbrandia_rubra.ctg3309.p1  ORF type:complete len:388 (+),score=39.70 Plantae.Rhodophyta-Hildenbrandia_rubra.ctg3309:1042-2205(+)